MALSVSTSPELSTLKFSDQGTLILSSSETKKGNSAINSSDIFQIIPTYALSNIRVSVDAYGGFWSRTYINASPDWSGGTPLYVSAISGQTGDLTKWQNSAGTTLARVASNGVMKANVGLVAENSTLANYTALQVNSTITNGTGVVVQGASGQTANLQEWYAGNGTLGTRIGPYGELVGHNQLANGIGGYIGGVMWSVISGNSGYIPIVVKGAASQTANLQEWQDSSGNKLAKITSSGGLIFGNGGSGAGITTIYFDQVTTSTNTPDGITWNFVTTNTKSAQILAVRTAASYATDLYFATANPADQNASEKMRIGSTGTVTINGFTSSNVGLIIKAAASQTANLQEWQDSAGTVMAKVTSGGSFTSYNTNFFGRTFFLQDGSTNASTQASGAYFAASSANSAIYARTLSASIVPLVVQGTTSQSANLQEWQNVSATTLALVDAYGRLGINTTSLANSTGAYSMLSVYNNNTVNTNLTIKAYASQTANMQEWQNSAGTVLTRIASDGSIYRGATTIDSYGAIYTTETMAIGASSGQRFATGGMTIINREQTSAIIFGVKGIASQTGDLTQWRNSSDTILAKVDANGNFSAITKSFDIPHPTKENMRLRYASLEGPENGVYVRGTAESNIIELPEYWTGLVHEDSITVSLTAVGSAQNIYVEKIEDNKVYIGGELTKAFFTVYGERKDIDKLTVEY